MKEINGRIISWDKSSERGEIQGHDGELYSFTNKEWIDDKQPEIDGGVLVICQNGRDPSKIEYLPLEPHSTVRIDIDWQNGEMLSSEQQRFLGGPWRMLSDSLAWMKAAKILHSQISKHQINDNSGLLGGVDIPFSLRGSVIKYCFGFSIELYLKWILVEAKIKFRRDTKHRLKSLINKLPDPVHDNLRSRYSDFYKGKKPELKMWNLGDKLDWSTFDKFIENIDCLKFIIGRYAHPDEYTIFPTSSR